MFEDFRHNQRQHQKI